MNDAAKRVRIRRVLSAMYPMAYPQVREHKGSMIGPAIVVTWVGGVADSPLKATVETVIACLPGAVADVDQGGLIGEGVWYLGTFVFCRPM